MIKLQSDFLGPYIVEDGAIVRPMAPNTLKLSGELESRRNGTGESYTVSDLNDDQEVWHPTMKEIVYLEAHRFLKPAEFERFVCLGSAATVFRVGSDIYPRIVGLFTDGFDPALPHMKSHLSLAKVIEGSYYRRLAKNHFTKARAIRDGMTPRFGMSTDVMTRKG